MVRLRAWLAVRALVGSATPEKRPSTTSTGGDAPGAARDLDAQGIRADQIAAGPLHTRAAGAIGAFDHLTSAWEHQSPMPWNPRDASPVADAATFLLSDLARMITAEILHVDGGFHAMAGHLAR